MKTKTTYRNSMGQYEVELWDEGLKKHVFSRSFSTLREARAFIARVNRLAGEYRLRSAEDSQ